MKRLILCCGAFFLLTASYAQKKVLWIGNSYTGANNLPQLTDDLANSLGDDITFDANTPGGNNFNNHANNPVTYQKINSNDWDVVILQAQSQEPSFPDAQVSAQTFPYATQMCDSIYENNSCTEAMFYMTWGRENGDPQWEPISTFEGMNERLRNAYVQMSNDNNASVAPVGVAWKYVRDNHPAIQLYTGDGSHPSFAGSYLAACVFYANIFNKRTEGATYIGSLSQDVATKLQKAADSIVFETDFHQWRNGSKNAAYFDVSQMDETTNIVNGCIGSNLTYEWDFGNGTSSTDENPSPSFSNGNYAITLVTTNSCGTDTTTRDYTYLALGIQEENQIPIQLTQFQNGIEVFIDGSEKFSVNLISLDGKLIDNQSGVNTIRFDNITSRIYMIQIKLGAKIMTRKVKI